jgi:hypothetical protein
VAQRLVGHHRPEVGAADADVDDVADALPGVTGPLAGADRCRERRHTVEHRVDFGHDVGALGRDRGLTRRAQRDMQDRAVLGDVDVLAGEHRVDAVTQPGLLGELDEEPQRLVRHPVLRVVEEEALRLGGQPPAALGILREQLSQVAGADLTKVRLERSVGRTLAKLGLGQIRVHAAPPDERHRA